MSSNRDKTSSRGKPRRSKAEEEAEEARLDALIAAPSKPSAEQAKSILPSRLDKLRTEQKSVIPSRLDNAHQDQKSAMQSRLDESRMEKSKLPSKLDQSQKEQMLSRLDQVNKEIMASRLDKSEVGKSAIKTTFTNPHDIEMASRQTKYDTLSPEEQQKQEVWAQEKIAEVGCCISGFEWDRVPGGYHCQGGSHWMSDELLVEGKGGWYSRRFTEGDIKESFGNMNTRRFARYDPSQRWSRRGALETAHDIGFSKGLDAFNGPFYLNWDRGNFPGMLNSNHPLYKQLHGRVSPGRQDLNQQQGAFNPYDPYGNNKGHLPFGRRQFRR